MSMDQAAVWLASSILFTLGLTVIIIGIIVINNLLHKYWKAVRIFTPDSWNINPPIRYVTEEELTKVDPQMNKPK